MLVLSGTWRRERPYQSPLSQVEMVKTRKNRLRTFVLQDTTDTHFFRRTMATRENIGLQVNDVIIDTVRQNLEPSSVFSLNVILNEINAFQKTILLSYAFLLKFLFSTFTTT